METTMIVHCAGRIALQKNGMTYGSLIGYESQKIRKTVLSTAVAELYSFMKCFVSCLSLQGLDTSCEVANVHMKTNAKIW